jgi:hypothetical protein
VVLGIEFVVWGLGFRVWDLLGFRVRGPGLGLRFQGLEFRILDLQ